MEQFKSTELCVGETFSRLSKKVCILYTVKVMIACLGDETIVGTVANDRYDF